MRLAILAIAALFAGSALADTPFGIFDQSVTGNMASSGAVVSETLAGADQGTVTLSGTFSGTLNVQCVPTAGSAYNLQTLQSNAWVTTAFSTVGVYFFKGAQGCPTIQTVFASYTSGTATVTINASYATTTNFCVQPRADQLNMTEVNSGTLVTNTGNVSTAVGAQADSAAASDTATASVVAFLKRIAQNITTVSTTLTNQTAKVLNFPQDGNKTTYRAASAAAFASATTATDICTVNGSATKTVRVTRLWLSATQTTSGEVNVFLLKRSAADTGGTSASLVVVPNDSNNASGTASAKQYTANPTSLGTLVGTVSATKLAIPVVAIGGNANQAPITEVKFGDGPDQALVLRGTAEGLAVNLASTTVSGGSWLCTWEWTEE